MTDADEYFPRDFNLATGPVRSVRTADAPPQVQFDSTGLWAKDASGAYVFQLNAALGTGFFAGAVTAQGLTLAAPLGASTPDADRVRWVQSGGGFVPAYATGYTLGGPPATAGALDFVAQSPDGHNTVTLDLLASNSGGAGDRAQLQISGATQGFVKTLLDNNGASDFVQAAAFGVRKIAVGTASFNWDGVSSALSVSFTHNLGGAPTVQITASGPRFEKSYTLTVRGTNTCTVVVDSRAGVPAAQADSFDWYAFL